MSGYLAFCVVSLVISVVTFGVLRRPRPPATRRELARAERDNRADITAALARDAETAIRPDDARWN